MPIKKNASKRQSEIKEESLDSKKSKTSRRNRASSLTNDLSKDKPSRRRQSEEVVLNKVRDRGLLLAGNVLTMGTGDVGQLGLGPDVIEKTRPAIIASLSNVVEASAGGMHSICLTEDGKVVTFGCNDEGALGRDTSVEGTEWSPGNVELEGNVVQVSAGDSHSAVLFEDGRVFAWGTFRDSSGTVGLLKEGKVERLPVEILKEGAVRLASGADHLVILTKDGHVLTCGCGEQGQLGRVSERSAGRWSRQGIAQLLMPSPIHLKPYLKPFFDEIWTGAYCTFARERSKGHIYICGLNNYNQLGHPKCSSIFHPIPSPTFVGRHWIQISAGLHHTLALDKSGVAHALGRKEYGRLGLGSEYDDDAKSPTAIPSLLSKKVKWVGCGSSVSYAVTEDGAAFSWGMGTNYQLGFGDDSDELEPRIIKSKQLEGKKALSISGGGQHAVILAAKAESVPAVETAEDAAEDAAIHA